MADFIAEFTLPNEDNLPNEIERWMIQTDGLLDQKRGKVRVVIITPDEEMLKYEI